MRSLSLVPAVLLALSSALPSTAVPIEMTKVIPLPGIGPLTVGGIGPTQIPNLALPNPNIPVLPHRRSNHDPVNIRPRQIHNADFSASPNSTIPTAPSAPSPASKAKRAGKPKSPKAKQAPEHHVDIEKPGEKKDKATASSADASGPAAAAGGVAEALRTVGGAPKQLSSATNSAPVVVPDTPVTQPDNSAANAAAAAAAAEAAKAPAPVEEAAAAEPAPPANAGAYPHMDGFDYSATPAPPPAPAGQNQKRHSLVMDTDPVLPPADMAGKDPSMGLLNVDSNRKPEDDVDTTPKSPVGGKGGAPADLPTVEDAPEPKAAPASTSSDAQPAPPQAPPPTPQYPAYSAA